MNAIITPQTTSCHVFLVEDEHDLRKDLSFLLEDHGYKVTACASAAEFYREFAVRPASVVVLDIVLGGEDGLSICKHLRTHNPLQGIIFLTARGMKDDRLQGLMTGADAYLVKPVEFDELCLTIDRLAEALQHNSPGHDRALSMLSRGAGLTQASKSHPLQVEASSGPSSASWVYETKTGLLIAPNGKSRRLSSNDTIVLQALCQREGEVVSVDELADQLGIAPSPTTKHRVEVIVSRLKRGVEQVVGQSLTLYLLRGAGYRLLDVRMDTA